MKLKLLTINGVILTCVTTFAAAMAAHAEEHEPAATPYRPTVSNPADLSEPGWLEAELGWQRAKGGGDAWRNSLPALAKLAFTENWGILVGNELNVRRTDMSNVQYTGGGDTTLLVKHRIPTATEGTSWGFEAGVKLSTAKNTIGSGKSDDIFNGIYSTDFSGNHLDLNLGATRVGAIASGTGRMQYNWAAALSRNLDEQWGVFGEFSGSSQRGVPAQSQFMTGLTYNYSKRVVFDTGATSGLTSASPDWMVFAGVTVLLGKIW